MGIRISKSAKCCRRQMWNSFNLVCASKITLWEIQLHIKWREHIVKRCYKLYHISFGQFFSSSSVGDWIDFTYIYIHLNSTIWWSHTIFNIVIITTIIIISMVIFIIIWRLDESGWISGSHLGGRHVSGPTLTAALHRATHVHCETLIFSTVEHTFTSLKTSLWNTLTVMLKTGLHWTATDCSSTADEMAPCTQCTDTR